MFSCKFKVIPSKTLKNVVIKTGRKKENGLLTFQYEPAGCRDPTGGHKRRRRAEEEEERNRGKQRHKVRKKTNTA